MAKKMTDNTHMRFVVVTEYCKSMSSQSGRQMQSDSVTLLICLKNSCALLALRKGWSKRCFLNLGISWHPNFFTLMDFFLTKIA